MWCSADCASHGYTSIDIFIDELTWKHYLLCRRSKSCSQWIVELILILIIPLPHIAINNICWCIKDLGWLTQETYFIDHVMLQYNIIARYDLLILLIIYPVIYKQAYKI